MGYVSNVFRKLRQEFVVVFTPAKKIWHNWEELDRKNAEYLSNLSEDQRRILCLYKLNTTVKD